MSAKTVFGLLILTLCGVGAGTATEEAAAPASAPWSVATSSSGRFVVTGPDGPKITEYTQWAEAMAERLERRLGMPLAFSRQSPLRLRLVPAGSADAGVAAQWQYRDGRLCGDLTVNEYARLDYEDLLAAWCRLALAALVDRGQARRDTAGGKPPPVPEWLATGLAQNLDPVLCARNRRLVHETMSYAAPPEVAQVLSWDSLPEGWHRTRAVCGLMVMWLDTLKPQGESWRLIIDRLASGEAVTAGWVGKALAGVNPDSAVEAAWGGWLKRQERVVQDLGAVSSVLIGQLREVAEGPVPEADGVGPAPADGGGRLGARDLIARRERGAVRLLAEERMQQVQALTIGKAPELVRVGRLYTDFFEGLARGAGDWTLRRRLRRAEEAMNALAELTRAREAYVDAFEGEAAPAGAGDEAMGPPPVLVKGRLEAYVDAVEERFGRAEEEQAGAARREGAARDDHGTETDPQDNRRND